MKIGIVSDSHGKADRLRRALTLLKDRGAEVIVHCGDIGRAECLIALAETHLPVYAVAGNMDHNAEQLQEPARQRGIHFSLDALLVPLDNDGFLAVTHGNNPGAITSLLADAQCRYVCHGHTHVPRDDRLGHARVINPGAVHRAGRPSAAILDTQTDTLEHIELS